MHSPLFKALIRTCTHTHTQSQSQSQTHTHTLTYAYEHVQAHNLEHFGVFIAAARIAVALHIKSLSIAFCVANKHTAWTPKHGPITTRGGMHGEQLLAPNLNRSMFRRSAHILSHFHTHKCTHTLAPPHLPHALTRVFTHTKDTHKARCSIVNATIHKVSKQARGWGGVERSMSVYN